jgi:hypothetical protein
MDLDALGQVNFWYSLFVVIPAGVLGAWLHGYLKKKFEYLADSDSIEELTAKVEEVRSVFAKDLEKVRNDFNKELAELNSLLSVDAGVAIEHRNYVRLRIIEFFDAFMGSYRAAVTSPKYDLKSVELTLLYPESIDRVSNDLSVQKSRLEVFFDLSKDLLVAVTEMKKELIHLEYTVRKQRSELVVISKRAAFIESRRESLEISFEEYAEQLETINEEIIGLQTQISEQIREFMTKFYQDFYPVVRQEVRSLLKDTLSKG